jgi:hypothetical protein
LTPFRVTNDVTPNRTPFTVRTTGSPPCPAARRRERPASRAMVGDPPRAPNGERVTDVGHRAHALRWAAPRPFVHDTLHQHPSPAACRVRPGGSSRRGSGAAGRLPSLLEAAGSMPGAIRRDGGTGDER